MSSSDDEENVVEWTWEEDKAFEKVLAFCHEGSDEIWEKFAEAVPGKSLEEIKHHYELLVEDINNIEAGIVPLPEYVCSEDGADQLGEKKGSKKGGSIGGLYSDGNPGGKGSRDQERRKGVPWSEEEHRLFLLGLDKYGKGDWRSISRNFVVSRTPTQVASHAQKYFIRMTSTNKDRRRSSIHDITSVEKGDISNAQGPITGQTNATATGSSSSGKPSKHQSHTQPPPPPGVAIYGPTTVGQPVGGPAVGTPVNLPAPGGHMAYGVRAPVPMLPGAPTSMAPMMYQMPHASAHR
ncbi:hypothetical protein ACHQM5_004990 [Ranunculus cassubicifolius]